MDKAPKTISLLEHIIKWCDEITEAHDYFGDNFEVFKDNIHYFKSVTMSLLQIGELVNHLPSHFTEKYSNVAWRKIIGLRNIIVHGYGILETKTIWESSHEHTIELQKQCNEIISEIQKETK